MNRETPLGFLRYARMFHEAGVVLTRDRRRFARLHVPMLYLFGHSIELSLKAFLRAKGLPVKQLKSGALGHDLEALVSAVKKHGMDSLLCFTRPQLTTIATLNVLYKKKLLEYTMTGLKIYPLVDEVQKCSDSLIQALTPLCESRSHDFAIQGPGD